MHKFCNKCKLSKPLEQFHRRNKGHQSICKSCRKKLDCEYFQANKEKRRRQAKEKRQELREWYSQLKAQPCADCGVEYPSYVMDWDHLPSKNKSGYVSDILMALSSKIKILEEIKNCELVCSNCHRIRTYNRQVGVA